MDPLPTSPVRSRANICLTCGDKGEIDLLIFCQKCRDSVVHQYCLGQSSNDDNIYWLCWDCAPNDTNAEPSRKSQRISAKKQKVLKTRYNWKERLKQNKRQVGIGNGVNETAQLATEDHLQIADVKTQHDISEEKNSRFKIQGHSDDHNESIRMDEPTLASASALSPKEESSLVIFNTIQKIPDVAKNGILGVKDSNKSFEEHKIIDHQVPPLAACMMSETFYRQNSSKADHCHDAAEPVTDPIWRGSFNINEKNETYLEILAHPSNKASTKAYEAATAFPAMLDIQVLDKQVVLPMRFRSSPPTAASIALYFFPACIRVERAFDSLLDEVIERDLALKAMIHDVELLIFTSRELPLQHWRHCSKYYLWGVFNQNKRCQLPKAMDTHVIPLNSRIDSSQLWKPTFGNDKDGDQVSSPTEQSTQSCSSKNSNKASNLVWPSIAL